MEYEVYCDESRPELFVSSQPAGGKTVLGSLWMPADYRSEFKATIASMRERHNVRGEFKWKKVSRSRFEFYSELVTYFFNSPELRFRAIVVDAGDLDMGRFHGSDAELGFYKFYYQMLLHWIDPDNGYSIFCDDKVNRDPGRLTTLARVLRNARPRARIDRIQSVPSSQSVAVQLCDLLLGAAQSRVNHSGRGSEAKAELLTRVEGFIGHQIAATAQSETKFNVFKINLRGEHRWY